MATRAAALNPPLAGGRPNEFNPRPHEKVTTEEIQRELAPWIQKIPNGQRSYVGQKLYDIALRFSVWMGRLPRNSEHKRLYQLDRYIRDMLCVVLMSLRMWAFPISNKVEEVSRDRIEFLTNRLMDTPLVAALPPDLRKLLEMYRDLWVAIQDYNNSDFNRIVLLTEVLEQESD
ncbi:hypothetical protein EJ08DRAFT_697500 [Tothia fuscella]|uniref:Uncharacterized protein n=1 Tax=Tothia fuscella TaxID=1048955 RepID=A0A9P4NQI3_9PEZI|nr:hypothetical protein EJ08DRAFT_697500 [Tothia fuscella]